MNEKNFFQTIFGYIIVIIILLGTTRIIISMINKNHHDTSEPQLPLSSVKSEKETLLEEYEKVEKYQEINYSLSKKQPENSIAASLPEDDKNKKVETGDDDADKTKKQPENSLAASLPEDDKNKKVETGDDDADKTKKQPENSLAASLPEDDKN
ncbi:MAG: hypothetical protein Q8831_02190, partial ['Bonamia sp.' little leaf phytoplasma]|nr:hypothetical protein ['Bonamia sp.' little leaf phytoplasma]